VTNGDDGRGYGVEVGPHLMPGVSVFRVCAPLDWVDGLGQAVHVDAGACQTVEFEVRP
jgi:hypothetical protein